MRYLLDLAYYCLTPVLLAALCLRRRFRAGLGEKLGGVAALPRERRRLLVHAVSVGEVRTALPLIDGFRRRRPEWDVIVTTTTDSGRETARRALGDEVPVVYFPLDYSWAVRRTLRALEPSAVVLVELELWPNFLLACRAAGVPALVVNGRLTERSAGRYRLAGPAGRFLFSLPTAFAVQNEDYAARFAGLGVERERIAVLGNLKFDAPVPETPPASETLARLGWEASDNGSAPPIVMGGCTHPGEERALLESLSSAGGNPCVVLAPRHIERSDEVVGEAQRAGVGAVARWSELRDGGTAPSGLRVLVVDAIGELDRFYSIADLAFVGGSLVPHGGHNMLEPARHGKPVVFGPAVHNFEDVARHLLGRGGAEQVADGAGLAGAITRLLEDPEARRDMGARAAAASQELRGALDRHLDWIEKSLEAIPERPAPGF